MNPNDMSLKELRDVPCLPWPSTIKGKVKAIIIVQMDGRKLHDSGYRRMKFVCLDEKDNILGAVSGCSDVMCLGGIGGTKNRVKDLGWQFDCLKKSGCLRFWNMMGNENNELRLGLPLSTMEIWAE